jgi:hypothetical protein
MLDLGVYGVLLAGASMPRDTAKVSGLSKERLTLKETSFCMFRKKIRMLNRRSFYALTDIHNFLCAWKKMVL